MTIEPRFIVTLKELAGFEHQEWHDDDAKLKVSTDAEQASAALAIIEQFKNDESALKIKLQELHDPIAEGFMSKTCIFNIINSI
jgi:hypothetical protein